jgi:hypothetical protein
MVKHMIQVRSHSEQRSNDDLQGTTPAQRLLMVWPLTVEAWTFMHAANPDTTIDAESRLPRHVVRLRRGGG